MLFKVKLQEQLNKNPVPLRKLSRETGVSRPTLDRWLHTSQKQVDIRKIEAVCNYFGCDITDILEFAEKEVN